MRVRPISMLACGTVIVLAFALLPTVFPSSVFQVAMGNLVPVGVSTITVLVCLRNVVESRGHVRLFWGLMTAGLAMWWFDQLGWAWYEVFLHKRLPDPFYGDIVLFLHPVPLMAAVAIR